MRCTCLGASVFAAFALPAFSADSAPVISVNAGHIVGTIKPLQDQGLGPLVSRGQIDLTAYFKELGVRNVRLHDAPWTYDNVQDINYVFPREDADPERAESYDFALTDYYIQSITSLGINVIYRLGYSFDFFKPHTFWWGDPPKSYEKWADIAAHIVRHYDQGWDNGPSVKIKYWEIWNEPDDLSFFWTGTPEQYFELYTGVAKRLKALDPSIKVGGPALAKARDLNFLEDMLKYCRDHQVPLDFVSWHLYPAQADEVIEIGGRVRDLMDRYGFDSAESILDEWNYTFTPIFHIDPPKPGQPFSPVNPREIQRYQEWSRGEEGAAFDASVLIALQDAHVDIATFYTGTTMAGTGLFTPNGEATKAYDAFLAFRRLLDTPDRLEVKSSDTAHVTALAGISRDKSSVGILLAHRNNTRETIGLQVSRLRWQVGASYTVQAVDRRSDSVTTRVGKVAKEGKIRLRVDGPGVYFLTIRRGVGAT